MDDEVCTILPEDPPLTEMEQVCHNIYVIFQFIHSDHELGIDYSWRLFQWVIEVRKFWPEVEILTHDLWITSTGADKI